MAVNWKSNNDVTISDMKSSPNLFNFVSFLLSSLVANPSFMSIPSLVLELRQFLFVRDSPEIRKSEEPPSEFILQNAIVITNCDSTLKMLILLQKYKMKNKRC